VVAPEWFRRFSGLARYQSSTIRRSCRATLALVPIHPDGSPRPQHSVQRLVSIDVKSGVEKQLATLDPPPDSILAGRVSLHPDSKQLVVSFVRQHGKIYTSKVSTNPHPGSTD
jgi:hypothetical protein